MSKSAIDELEDAFLRDVGTNKKETIHFRKQKVTLEDIYSDLQNILNRLNNIESTVNSIESIVNSIEYYQ